MRFSSTIVLTAVVALASSISATPIDDGAEHCTGLCIHDSQCDTCGPLGGYCAFPFCFGWHVSRVFAFTIVQYGRWH
ncbi:hypothetical protein P692DRAFT_20796961 [Suillus brevipes Sb2]|nr:hypothetical protein P692DRAFT_20796961 [Suillus brevipes Sb2]